MIKRETLTGICKCLCLGEDEADEEEESQQVEEDQMDAELEVVEWHDVSLGRLGTKIP